MMITRWLGPSSIAVILSLAALPAAAQNQLWITQIGTSSQESPAAAAKDGADGVFFGGRTEGSLGGPGAGLVDAWLASYNSAGNKLWILQFGTSGYDEVIDIAPSGSGGVYASGLTSGNLGGPNAGSTDAWLARYDSAGSTLWTRQFGTSASEVGRVVAPDGAGGVYVSGSTEGSLAGPPAGSYDAWVARYDGAGNQLWIRQLGTNQWEAPFAGAPDGSGGVYVGGLTFGSLGGPNVGSVDAWLARYDSAGNKLWIRQLGTNTFDGARAAASDGAGGVYVGGYTSGNLGGPNAGSTDAWLARYDSAGSKLWIRQFGTSEGDSVHAAGSDSSGGVYVSGYTDGNLTTPNAGLQDAWLGRYDSAGNQLWIDQFGTSAYDSANAVSSDGASGVYVNGMTGGSLGGPNAGSYDVWLARYDGSCNSGETYCTASSTSIPGCQAAISATGSPTLTDPTAHTISSGPVPGANLGLLLFGSSGPASTPYGTLGGKLCVAAPTFWTTPKTSGGDQGQCNGSYSFALADLIAASPIVTSGATLHAQVWARDPANPDGFLLSDGLEVVVCP